MRRMLGSSWVLVIRCSRPGRLACCDIARQTGGRLAELLASGGPREQLFAALLDELDQSARPQVVVIEDAHWADEATLDLVFLGRRMERTRALLIISYRDDELAVDHPLRAVVGRLTPETACATWLLATVRGGGGGAGPAGRPPGNRAAPLTKWNSLLVAEVLAAGEPGAGHGPGPGARPPYRPASVDAKMVVWLVAVVPTRTELWLLEEALRPEPTAGAPRLIADHRRGGGRVPPRAALAGRGLGLGPGPRDLHRRVLQVLSDAQGRGVDIARLVHHARQADDADAVLRYAPEAARQAAAVAAHREAVGHYRTALRHADRLSPPVRAELLESYSVEAYLSGLSPEAVSARRAALELREGRRRPGSGSGRGYGGCRGCTGGRSPEGGGGGRRPCHRRAGDPAAGPPAGHGLQQPGPTRHTGLPRRDGDRLGLLGDRAGPAAGRPGDPHPCPDQHRLGPECSTAATRAAGPTWSAGSRWRPRPGWRTTPPGH